MPLIKLNLNQRKYRDDPWGEFAKLRQHGNVIRIKMPFTGKTWAATAYDAVNEVLKDTDRFVRDPHNAGRKNFVPFQWLLPKSFFQLTHNMMGSDGEKHRRLRMLVDRAFAMRNIGNMDERIQELADEQLQVLSTNLDDHGRADLIADFARPFPLTVICELLGLPMQDRPKFIQWFAPFSTISSVFGILKLNRGIKAIISYLKAQFEDVRKTPRDGLITKLVEAELEGERLNEDELLATVFLLLVAGHETTVHLISNLVLTLLAHPTAKQEVLSDHSLIEPAIEETLRYCSPVQIGKPRYVVDDCEFEGQQLKRGQLITPLLACANYDHSRFPVPDQFNIHRDRNYHMTFGSGPHVCLGMKLARSETKSAFISLFQRYPNLTADFDLQAPNWGKRFGMRNLEDFYVTKGK